MNTLEKPATIAVRASLESDAQYGAVVPPLHLSSNYTFAGYCEKRQYDYCRSGNPTRDALERNLAALEGPEEPLSRDRNVSAPANTRKSSH